MEAALPKPERPSPAEYFRRTEEVFEQAVRQSSNIRRHYRIGDRSLRLRFAGPALVSKIAPAFEHLRSPARENPDLEIRVWDSASTGVAMPSPPWNFDYYLSKGEVREFTDENVFTAFQHGPDALNLWERRAQSGIFWVRDAARLPYYESSAPLRYLLQAWALGTGRQLVHGATVGLPGAGLLLTGKGGMGKSTTAVSVLGSSLAFAGDDYVLLGLEPHPTSYSLYATAKLNEDTLSWFPGLRGSVVNAERGEEEKAFVRLWPEQKERLVPSLPLKAVAIPRLGGDDSCRFEPISAIECLKALAPSTLVQLPGADEAVFRQLCRLVKILPAYRFHLCREPRRIAEAIRDFLARL